MGRCNWRPWVIVVDVQQASYHKRSNSESTFSAIKRKFGGAVRSKTFTAQRNEILCKILCHNLSVLVHAIHELGIEPTFGSARPPATVTA